MDVESYIRRVDGRQVPALVEAMKDLLLTCFLLSQCGTGPISLYENHKCRSMKTFRLVEAMEDQLFDMCFTVAVWYWPISLCEIFGVEHGRCS